jgi:hypothetical protein
MQDVHLTVFPSTERSWVESWLLMNLNPGGRAAIIFATVFEEGRAECFNAHRPVVALCDATLSPNKSKALDSALKLPSEMLSMI